MPPDNNTITEPTISQEPIPEVPEITTPDTSSQTTGSIGADMPSESPEGSRDVVGTVPIKDDNSVFSQSESQTPETIIEPKTATPAVAVATVFDSPAPSFLH